MKSRKEAIDHCLTYPGAYEDYPFSDTNWTVMRHKANNKVFAWIFEKDGHIWINVKGKPEMCDFWRNMFDAVVPAYHLNKMHWNSIILDGTVPEKSIEDMIFDSYKLTGPKIRNNKK